MRKLTEIPKTRRPRGHQGDTQRPSIHDPATSRYLQGKFKLKTVVDYTQFFLDRLSWFLEILRRFAIYSIWGEVGIFKINFLEVINHYTINPPNRIMSLIINDTMLVCKSHITYIRRFTRPSAWGHWYAFYVQILHLIWSILQNAPTFILSGMQSLELMKIAVEQSHFKTVEL